MGRTEPIRSKRQVQALVDCYKNKGQVRNWVLCVLSVYTALRISDILALSASDVYDFKRGCVRETITLTEKKTGKGKIVALNGGVITALEAYFTETAPGAPLILNPRTGKAISRVHAYRLINCPIMYGILC